MILHSPPSGAAYIRKPRSRTCGKVCSFNYVVNQQI